MAITKAKKKEIVEKAADILKKGNAFVFVNFNKLKVNDGNAMRKELRAKGVGYFISKKTLLTRALNDLGSTGTLPVLDGQVALAYGEDLLAPAREVYAFEKKFKDTIKIIGGIFEGGYFNREQMLSIATIPPQEILYGQFVNIINSPIQRMVIALDQIAQKKA